MTVWEHVEELSDYFKNKLKTNSDSFSESFDDGWENIIFQSKDFRRAHLQIIDYRKKHKIYILHLTIFPNLINCSPIFGFDIVSGENKITGVFHDFSVVDSNEKIMKNWFEEESKKYDWNKIRTLPSWAEKIFSKNMVAIGNVRVGPELDDVCMFAKESLDFYLNNISKNLIDNNYVNEHDNYCRFQKQNPHVINSMVSMGIQKERMEKFVDEVLFPESHTYYYAK